MTDKAGTLLCRFEGPADTAEWLIAELSEFGFGAFEETTEGVLAYGDELELPPDATDELRRLVAPTGHRLVSVSRQAPRNWNERWERGITPVSAGPFCVHPPWHPPEPGLRAICIEPKMSFGTAHHATTRLMLRGMPHVVRSGDSVLDAGTGTGVLAIAARMLGARQVIGFDIDPWSEENARENLERNQTTGVEVRIGGLPAAGPGPFDAVLANINRRALQEMLPGFTARLAAGGRLLLSGVLRTDRAMMESAVSAAGLRVIDVDVEDEWITIRAEKPVEP
ncbi:MAG: 50S ribosomal protein L11 methyltransferase [Rhodothermales bacterium]|nr:50S ribosomal protein L11 methyltransferase [Rhodothermales bacterium]MBO6781379.1 50S ribosomal protein L11 methyltransferase [Rhodothermales bacterium]